MFGGLPPTKLYHLNLISLRKLILIPDFKFHKFILCVIKLKCYYLFHKRTFKHLFSIHLHHEFTFRFWLKNNHPFENLDFNEPLQTHLLKYNFQNHPLKWSIFTQKHRNFIQWTTTSRTKIKKSKTNSPRSIFIF